MLIFQKLWHRILLIDPAANHHNANHVAAYAPGFAPQ